MLGSGLLFIIQIICLRKLSINENMGVQWQAGKLVYVFLFSRMWCVKVPYPFSLLLSSSIVISGRTGLLRWSSLQIQGEGVKDVANFFSSGSKIVKRLRRRKYDPVIIERTIGRVLGPFYSLVQILPIAYCTLTNKALTLVSSDC